MANGFLTALQEIESFHVGWRMANPAHDSTEWLTSLLSRWRIGHQWNSNFNLYTHMKPILIALATIVAVCAQTYFIGLNGLTLISIPMTIYLGLLVIEKVTEKKEEKA